MTMAFAYNFVSLQVNPKSDWSALEDRLDLRGDDALDLHGEPSPGKSNFLRIACQALSILSLKAACNVGFKPDCAGVVLTTDCKALAALTLSFSKLSMENCELPYELEVPTVVA